MKQDDLIELIERASKSLGSERKLAQSLGIPAQHVSGWKHGSRNPQPEDIALLAGAAGLNAEQWAMRAMVEKHEGTAKGDRLMKVLGKASLATIAAISSSGASAAAIFGSAAPDTLQAWLVACSTMYRNVKFPTHRNSRPRGGFFMLADGR